MDESEITRLRNATVPGNRPLVARKLPRALLGKPVDVTSLAPGSAVEGVAGFWADASLCAPIMIPNRMDAEVPCPRLCRTNSLTSKQHG